jgi:acyl-coenzyme A thioesterase PaaI-like protein
MANPILLQWRSWSARPMGRWIFSKMLSRMVPYSGTIRPEVLLIEPGRAEVAISDRRSVRNHLNSIHAIALVNLGELASGLALNAGLPDLARGIVTHLEIDYLKKARGRLIARCLTEIPDWRTPCEHVVEAPITDAEGDVVARVRVRWKIGPKA